MWPYWLMYLVPAIFALTENRHSSAAKRGAFAWPAQWWLVWLVLCVIVGLRDEVGGDWINYLNLFDYHKGMDFEILSSEDFGYRLLEFISDRMNFGIYGVNFFASCIFSLGLVTFCCSLRRPWLALAVSIPYVVIVVGMGYSRQALALGCSLIALTYLGRHKTAWFVFWVVLGATFHKSAVIMIPIAALAGNRRKWLTYPWVLATAYVAYELILSSSVETFKANYIDAQYQSQGAAIRLMMNSCAAVIFLFFRNHFLDRDDSAKVWIWLSLFSISLLLALPLSPSSTALDRIALYLLPLQMYVFSALVDIPIHRDSRRFAAISILAFYALALFTWLNFANNSFAWLPYRNYLPTLLGIG